MSDQIVILLLIGIYLVAIPASAVWFMRTDTQESPTSLYVLLGLAWPVTATMLASVLAMERASHYLHDRYCPHCSPRPTDDLQLMDPPIDADPLHVPRPIDVPPPRGRSTDVFPQASTGPDDPPPSMFATLVAEPPTHIKPGDTFQQDGETWVAITVREPGNHVVHAIEESEYHRLYRVPPNPPPPPPAPAPTSETTDRGSA